MAHKCKCAICNVEFDRDKIQAVRHGARRYAHLECYPSGELVPLPVDTRTQEEKDKQALIDYAKQLLGDSYISRKVNKQIKEFKEKEEFTYSGMLKSLVYFYDVQGNDISKAAGGIGIVPFVYKQAYDYYLALYMAQQNNESKTFSAKVREITIKPPTVEIKKRMFDFLEDDYE